ncbi:MULTISPECIES: LysE family translocator [unclassified Knoellia]|uniref:LysE family translocator n=1 Tax=Knoellia altitudinis TaxID=3404795 RepID=UPI0036203A6E
MTAAYLVVVLAVIVTPGVDVLVTLRNTVAAGRRAGFGTVLGIGAGSAMQGVLASVGVGAVIVRVQPLFQVIKWAGVAYLVWLGISAWRSALAGSYAEGDAVTDSGMARGFRTGALTNLTNPKMLVFYLALLPQFVAPTAPVLVWLGHALVLPVVGCAWLALIVLGATRVRQTLLRRRTRRVIDAVSGAFLVGFAARLSREA